jgi:filamentous hemagglutinin family protein
VAKVLVLVVATVWLLHEVSHPSATHAQATPKAVTTRIVETTRVPHDLGTRTTQVTEPTTNVTTTSITGGTRPGGGPNLFHSFDFFTVGSKDIAHFLNDQQLPTTNIIARVIGDAAGLRAASTIDGILRTNNPLNTLDPLNFGAANLYLVNPAGIIFGPNAQLDIKGSFAATTADYLRLSGNALFHTDPVQPMVLSIGSVDAFGFTAPRPVAISVQGATIAVTTGQDLSMLGGDFSMTNSVLQAPGARLQIASVASPGEVIPSGPGQAPSLDVSSFSQLGSVLEQGTGSTFSNISVSSTVSPTLGAGTILIRGNKFTSIQANLNASTLNVNAAPIGIDIQTTEAISFTTSGAVTTVGGTGRGGDIRLITDTLQINSSSIFPRALSGTGNTGALDVTGRLIEIRNGGQLGTLTQAAGRAGNVTIHADRVATLDGGIIFSTAFGTGQGGAIDVTAREFFGSAGSLASVPGCSQCATGISAQTGFGSPGGSVRVHADSVRLLDGAAIRTTLFSTGPGANVDVTAKDLVISGLVTVQSPTGPITQFSTIGSVLSGTFAQGTGGNVTVNAETIEIANNARITTFLLGGAPGNAGDIAISTSGLNIHDRGGIFATSFEGSGNSGDIDITASSINISGVRDSFNPGSVQDFTGLSASTSVGRGGTIHVTTNDLSVGNKGIIASTTFASGQAGNIQITGKNVSVLDAAQVTTVTGGTGHGGNIDITADQVRVSGQVAVPGALDEGHAAIVAQSTSGGGDAGSIRISTNLLDVDNGIINSDTLTTGKGGNIELNAATVRVTNNGEVTAASRIGNAGSITVDAEDTMITGVANSPDPFVTDFTGFSVKTIDGQGGALNFTGGNLTINEKGSITSATTGSGNAGSITLQLTNNLAVADGSLITASTSGSGTGGTIGIHADALMLSDQSRIESGTSGSGAGGTITAKVGEGMILSGQSSFLATAQGLEANAGNAGSIMVEAKNIALSGGSQLTSATIGPGQGGSVTVQATESVNLAGEAPNGQGTGLFATTQSTAPNAGNAGSIVVETPGLSILDGAQLTSATGGPGRGGQIFVDANDILIRGRSLDNLKGSGLLASSFGTESDAGDAGSIVVNANHLTLQDGAVLASDTFGPGDGGSITVKATGDISLLGTGLFNPSGSGIFATSSTSEPGAGNAGSILVEGKTVTVEGGTQISSSTHGSGQGGSITVKGTDSVSIAGFSPDGFWLSALLAQSLGTEPGAGKGGEIAIEAPRISVADGAAVATLSEGPGHAGNILLKASDQINVVRDSFVLAAAQGLTEDAGNAGGITVETGRLRVTDGSVLASATFGPGQGGSIRIVATNEVTLTGVSAFGPFASGLFASSESPESSAGNAGDIVVQATKVTVEGGAVISSATRGAGTGGSVEVRATETVTVRGTSEDGQIPSGISANTLGMVPDAGDAGVIIIQGKNVSIQGGAMVQGGSLGPGAGGAIEVRAVETVTISGTSADELFVSGLLASAEGTAPGSGDAGAILVQGKDILIEGGAQIVSPTLGPGAGGAIEVRATEALTISGASPSGQIATGLFASAEGRAQGTGDAGAILIEGKNVTIKGGAAIESLTLGPGAGGDIEVSALENVTLTGTNPNQGFGSGLFAGSLGKDLGSGDAGNIVVKAKGLQLTDGGLITTSTRGPGHAGNILAKVGTLTLTNGAEISSASTGSATGAAGSVTIQGHASPADRVTLTDSTIATSAENTGRGGSITIDGTILTLKNATISATVRDFSTTDSTDGPNMGIGSISLTTSALNMDEGTITAATSGSRNAGFIAVAADALTVTNAQISSSSTGVDVNGDGKLDAQHDRLATGNAGSVTIEGLTSPANSVSLTNSTVLTSAEGTGAGGSITVETKSLALTTANVSASVTDVPEGGDPTQGVGNITLTASQSATLNGGTVISAESAGTRNAGTVMIDAGQTFLVTNSQVTTEALTTSGGNINISAIQMIRLINSSITTSVFGPEGTVGGNIFIDPQFVILQNSQILAQAFQGRGGNISINANTFLPDASSVISASSQFGLSGTVNINSPTQALSGALVPLKQNYLSGNTLSNQRCAARLAEGRVSSFVITEQDGLPQEPGGLLSSYSSDTMGLAFESVDRVLLASVRPSFIPLSFEQRIHTDEICRRR